jgi:hypothetical protein
MAALLLFADVACDVPGVSSTRNAAALAPEAPPASAIATKAAPEATAYAPGAARRERGEPTASQPMPQVVGEPGTARAASAGGTPVIDAPPSGTEVTLSPPRVSRTVNGIQVAVHRFINPARSGAKTAGYWTQFQAWGELANESSQVLQLMNARVVWFDAGGNVLNTESIGSLAQEDIGDFAEGENIFSDVEYVAPGQSVPFHMLRNLDAIKGEVAGFAIYPGDGVAVGDDAPRASVADIKDTVDAMTDSLEVPRRRISGRVVNEGTGRCRAPRVVYALLDERGLIRETSYFSVTEDPNVVFASGESRDFAGSFGFIGDSQWRGKAKLKLYAACSEPYD